MIALLASGVAAVFLLAGPDRRSPRAWAAMTVMLGVMLWDQLSPGSRVLGGAISLLTAIGLLIGASRASALLIASRSAALVATAGCVLGAAAPSEGSHEHPVLLVPVLLVLCLGVTIAALRSRRGVAMRGEAVAMAVAMTAMLLT